VKCHVLLHPQLAQSGGVIHARDVRSHVGEKGAFHAKIARGGATATTGREPGAGGRPTRLQSTKQIPNKSALPAWIEGWMVVVVVGVHRCHILRRLGSEWLLRDTLGREARTGGLGGVYTPGDRHQMHRVTSTVRKVLVAKSWRPPCDVDKEGIQEALLDGRHESMELSDEDVSIRGDGGQIRRECGEEERLCQVHVCLGG
jgi:hypothetical protein